MILENIKACCKEKNISLRQLEVECGFTVGLISKWDNSNPTVYNIAKVAEYFGKPIEYFLDEHPEEEAV